MTDPRVNLRSTRAIVAFDVIGEDTDAVMAWQFEQPEITIEPQYDEATFLSGDRLYRGRHRTGYKLTVQSWQARGSGCPARRGWTRTCQPRPS